MNNDLIARLRRDLASGLSASIEDTQEAADLIERLEAELKAAYANCRKEVEKIKTDPYTDLAKHHVIQYSSITARDWIIAMAEDIDRAIQDRAAVEGKTDDQ